MIQNISKKVLPLAFAAAAYSPCAAQESLDDLERTSKEESAKSSEIETKIEVEAEYFDLGETLKYTHKTHPDDYFLGLGPAGRTSIRRGAVISIGPEFSMPISDSFDAFFAPQLAFVLCRDEKRNDNDYRSKEHEAQIYSEIFPITAKLKAGLDYKITNDIAIGLMSSYIPFYKSDGWDRFNDDQQEHGKLYHNFNGGARINYQITKDSFVNAVFERGINTKAKFYGLGVTFRL